MGKNLSPEKAVHAAAGDKKIASKKVVLIGNGGPRHRDTTREGRLTFLAIG